jgi:DNA-binding response OmpR family regulator
MEPALLMLVEDAPEVVTLVRLFARRAGLRVEARPDVPSAWQFLAGVADPLPDLVLLDLTLPGEPGLALLRRLRGGPPVAGLPVALFTQWDRPDEVANGLDAGADYVISKELLGRPDAWQARIDEILRRLRGRGGDISLSSLGTPLTDSSTDVLLCALDRTFRLPSVRQLGPQVLTRLVGRAGERALAALQAAGAAGGCVPTPANQPEDWLTPDGTVPILAHLPALLRPGAAALLAVALAEELWRVSGADATALLRDALVQSFPLAVELLPPR